MQVLNFVPDDYIQRKLARKANLLCGLLAVAVVVALTGLFVALSLAEDSLADEEQAVEREVTHAARQVEQWNALRAKRQALLDRATKAARLLVPLPRSRILAEVASALPEGTSLVELSIAGETILVGKSTTGPAAKATVRGVRPDARAEEQRETRVRLLGLAPTDVEVAQLIAALSNSPHFDQVELSFSEGRAIAERSLRRFEVLFRLSDGAYRLSLASTAEEVRR